MVYREQEARELCSVCDAFADTSCVRCGAPLCRDHKPRFNQRCADCETTFLQSLTEEERQALRWRGFSKVLARTNSGVGLGLALVAAFTLYALVEAGLVAGLAVLGAGAVVVVGERLRGVGHSRSLDAQAEAKREVFLLERARTSSED